MQKNKWLLKTTTIHKKRENSIVKIKNKSIVMRNWTGKNPSNISTILFSTLWYFVEFSDKINWVKLTAQKLKTFTASLKLVLKVLKHDVIMMCNFTRLGIALNIFLYIILINPLPLLASKTQSKKDRDKLKHAQEERNSDFVKGKSKYKEGNEEKRNTKKKKRCI